MKTAEIFADLIQEETVVREPKARARDAFAEALDIMFGVTEYEPSKLKEAAEKVAKYFEVQMPQKSDYDLWIDEEIAYLESVKDEEEWAEYGMVY